MHSFGYLRSFLHSCEFIVTLFISTYFIELLQIEGVAQLVTRKHASSQQEMKIEWDNGIHLNEMMPTKLSQLDRYNTNKLIDRILFSLPKWTSSMKWFYIAILLVHPPISTQFSYISSLPFYLLSFYWFCRCRCCSFHSLMPNEWYGIDNKTKCYPCEHCWDKIATLPHTPDAYSEILYFFCLTFLSFSSQIKTFHNFHRSKYERFGNYYFIVFCEHFPYW